MYFHHLSSMIYFYTICRTSNIYFSSFIYLIVAFNHGLISSICRRLHDVSLSFLLNSSRIIFGIVTNYGWRHPIPLKKKRQCLVGFTFQLHWEWARPAKVGGKNLCAPIALPRHYTGKKCIIVHIMQLFVLNCLDKDGCNTVQTPCNVCFSQWWCTDKTFKHSGILAIVHSICSMQMRQCWW